MSSVKQLPERPPKPTRRRRSRLNLGFERTMAILAAINFAVVLFDLSYVRMRNFWLQGQIPIPLLNTSIAVPGLAERTDTSPITRLYDPIKGIEPYRDTEQYLNRVDEVTVLVRQQGLEGLRSPQGEALLEELRDRSNEMIDTNPFQLANKTGTLEKIKNDMRRLMFQTTDASSRESFQTFWTADYLINAQPGRGLDFFNGQIRPLINTNYYRSIDETGQFTDRFWHRIDIWFAAIFFIEFLARTFHISRQYKKVSWTDAMIWRCYDILLFLPTIPFLPSAWRLLRIIPVTIRLNEADLIELEPIRAQLSRGFVTSIAEEMTEVIILNAINQFQDAVNSGEFAQEVFANLNRPYINLTGINEVEVFMSRLFYLVVYDALPAIKPDIEALLRHNIERAVSQSPAYQGLQSVPGFDQISKRLTDQFILQLANLVTEGSQSAYDAMNADDPVGDQLFNQMVQNFGTALGAGVQQQHTLEELQTLISDFLDEVKVNYVKRLGDEDINRILQEVRQLQQSARQ
ncbi:MAG: hypothetical protein LRZ84_23905 [Desertifilum sp.]|nr:hypothetical protein [Desertifilum sp.]